MQTIATALHGTATEAFWAGTSFLLASTVFQPTFASLSNIFGRIPLIVTSLLLFLVGTLVAALSREFFVLLIGRTLQGLGGGGLQSITEVVVTDLVPLRVRSKYFAIISGAWSIGSVTGPVVGGVFTQKVSWRWMFYINLPFIGLALVIVPLFLRLNSVKSSVTTKLHRIDYLGVFLFTASTTSCLIPITWAGVEHSWLSWRTLTPLSVGVFGLILFLMYEAYLAPEPLVPLSIFRTRTSCIAYMAEVSQGIIMWCILYYLPLYFEASKSYSPVSAGLGIIPLTVTLAPSAVVMGFVIARSGKYYLANIVGWGVGTIGLGLMTLMDRDTETWKWILFMVFAGIGQGILVQSLRLTIQAASTNQNLATAAAMYVFFRCLGQTLGVAIGGVAFQNEVKIRLKHYPEFNGQALSLAKDAAALVEIIKGMPDGSPRKQDLQAVYADAFRVVCVLLTALSGVMLIACLFVKSYDLNRALETEQGFNYNARPISQVIIDGGESGGRSKRTSLIGALRLGVGSRRPSSRQSTLVEFPFEEPQTFKPDLSSSSTLQIPLTNPLSLPPEKIKGASMSDAVATPQPRPRSVRPRSRSTSRPRAAPGNHGNRSSTTAVRTPSVLSFSRPLSGSLRDRHSRAFSLPSRELNHARNYDQNLLHHPRQPRSSSLNTAKHIPPTLLSSPSALIVSGNDSSDNSLGSTSESPSSLSPSTSILNFTESLFADSHHAARHIPSEYIDYARYMEEGFNNEPKLKSSTNHPPNELETQTPPSRTSNETVRVLTPANSIPCSLYPNHQNHYQHRRQDSTTTTGTFETVRTFETARSR